MLFAVFFAFWRFIQIITLIPTIGMLAYFVDGYNKANALTPTYILVEFIVAILAAAWAIFTIFSYHRTSTNATYVSLIDLLFVGAFIGAVYEQRFITDADCTSVVVGSPVDVSLGIFGSASVNRFGVQVNKSCALLKASFAFGIINAIVFFFTAVLAYMHADRVRADNRRSYVRESHSHRRGTRSSYGPHSRHSSHHSHRRVYV